MTNPDPPRTVYEARDHAIQYNAETIIGATPEEVRAQIAAATAPLATLNAAQQAEIVRLSIRVHDAGLTDARLLALARRAGEVEDTDQAFAELDHLVTVAIEVQTRGTLGSNMGDFVDEVLARMAALSAENRDAEAAAEADRAFAEWEDRQRVETQKGIALLDAGLRADILRRDAASAAWRIVRRLSLEAPAPLQFFPGLCREAATYCSRGRDKALRLDLEVSIALWKEAVRSARNPGERGGALNDLGCTLRILGEWDSDTSRLEEAIEVLLAALEQRTRKRVPLHWADTQMNLANALQTLGGRESGSARLKEAVATYRLALEVWTRARYPQDWAWVQVNLGNTLRTLGAREAGTARLEEAVDAFRGALEELSRAHVPFLWAMAQTNLGVALQTLGERQSGLERLEEAVAAFRAALEEFSPERAAPYWAKAQMNLGNALMALGEREEGTVRLEEAVEAYRAALRVYTRERLRLDWARTQHNLGMTLTKLGEREIGTVWLEQAVDAYRAALEERTRERVPLDWAKTQTNLADALATIADRTGQPRTSALAAIDAALEVLRATDADHFLQTAEAARRRVVGD